MKIYNVQVFGIDNNSGNNATVIQSTDLNIEERLLFAQNQNKPACVFMESTDNESIIKLDYYYPHKRSPLCLHGTLAAAYVYFSNHQHASQLTIITSMNNQKIPVKKVENSIFLTVEAHKIDLNQVTLSTERLSTLLNLDSLVEPIEYYIASSGSPKLFVEISDLQLLYSLQPNLQLINEWSKINKINGIYVYCKLSDNNYFGRNFNHINPLLEDSATGVAVTAMTYHLKRDLIVYQGAATKNNCVMYTKFLDNKIQISGKVIGKNYFANGENQ